MSELNAMIDQVDKEARRLGFDSFHIVFEVVDYYTMNELAAYVGFPIRYPHWQWGMEYKKIAEKHRWGMGYLLEMIINNTPTYAYLQRGNSSTDQKTVVAHCYGHGFFFKHNFSFKGTDLGGNSAGNPGYTPADYNPNRRWIDKMANHAAIVSKHIAQQGKNKVEEFIDHCLCLENLVDANSVFTPKQNKVVSDNPEPIEVKRIKAKEYLDDFINPEEYIEEQKQKLIAEREQAKKFPEHPQRDVLLFLLENANLETWEHDILEVIRTEAMYYMPQRQTKICNESTAMWAQSQLMTGGMLGSSAEIIDYADLNSGVLATSKNSLNPYRFVALLQKIEDRWNKGQYGYEWENCDDMEERRNWNTRAGNGREKVFDVIRNNNDLTLIDEYMDEDFCREQKMFVFGNSDRNDRLEIQSREFHKVKQQLLDQLSNGGQPIIEVEDGNFDNRGELLLKHKHNGKDDLRMDYAKSCMAALARLWKRPTNCLTVIDGQQSIIRHDGKEFATRGIR